MGVGVGLREGEGAREGNGSGVEAVGPSCSATASVDDVLTHDLFLGRNVREVVYGLKSSLLVWCFGAARL